jgi:biotin carboxylase
MDAFERFLCIATSVKGHEFLRQCAEMGIRVTLLTVDKYGDADWPRECIEELATMPPGLNREQILNTVSWMARSNRFDRVVALHANDLETAAHIREHFRVPGMGATTAGCYRDKLAQRVIARAFGFAVPEFCRVLNYDELRYFMTRVPGPWMLTPRVGASSGVGSTITSPEQLWRTLDQLGDAQSHYILEQIVPGDVFQVDSIVSECEVKFSVVHQGPMQTYAVAITRTVDRDSRDAKEFAAINRELAPALGMVRGVTHAKFLRSHANGNHYFVEMGAQVGEDTFEGCPVISQLVEASTGVNLGREWARLEIADLRQESYRTPDSFDGYAGSVSARSQGTVPDLDLITDPAIVSRVHIEGHAGLIVRAATPERVQKLLEDFRAPIAKISAASTSLEQVSPTWQ